MLNRFTSIKYTGEATAKDGRIRQVSVTDGVLDLDLGEPGSQANPQATPETLFAAAYAASLEKSLADRAHEQHVDITGSSVTADVSRGSTIDDDDVLGIELKIRLPGLAPSRAAELVESARQSCRFSKATSGHDLLAVTVS